jgi:outer membrane lipoprotein-sorting protein
VVVEVDTPLEQVMAITDKVMLIYYPNAKKAFRIKSKNPVPPPFIQTILGAMKEDYGLIKQGYTFIKHEKKGDTLHTYWAPPPKQKKILGTFILGTLSNKLVYAEAQTPDGTPAIKSFYRNHLKFGDSYIPLDISSEYYNESEITREHITFSDVKFNPVIPDRILNFKIPDGIPTKEVEW